MDGRAVGRINAGFFGGDASSAASAAGTLIGEALATGKAKPNPTLKPQEPPDSDQ